MTGIKSKELRTKSKARLRILPSPTSFIFPVISSFPFKHDMKKGPVNIPDKKRVVKKRRNHIGRYIQHSPPPTKSESAKRQPLTPHKPILKHHLTLLTPPSPPPPTTPINHRRDRVVVPEPAARRIPLTQRRRKVIREFCVVRVWHRHGATHDDLL